MIEALTAKADALAVSHASLEGSVATFGCLKVVRVAAPSGIQRTLYRPVLCAVLQGTKQVVSGGRQLELSTGRSLVLSVDRPVVSHVSRASAAEPYLALAIELDLERVRRLAHVAPPASEPPDNGVGPLLQETGADLLDALRRLLDLAERPAAAAALHPGLLDEIHYWLLAGPNGALLARLALPDGRTQRIARAVAMLRAGFADQLPIERLAAAAGMSSSTFHHHFRATTSLSPTQFQKQLRLIEARRLMLVEGHNATQAAFAVGYESLSQFSREYARFFGAPPRRDTQATSLAALTSQSPAVDASRSPA